MTAHHALIGGSTTPVQQAHQATNAALMIDFDNVTMGIRSDLTKELKNLLESDIIKGRVAVQRAYADWRRYPQYIVPLSENSIDLIFAPAYGSSKKNATDIRLAIDAIELAITRPEIGTFILLSGDSDFSSLVLKLKEYGKYVIGVGIKESSSDLLVQNCHEYYSYNAITGLTRAGEDEPSARMDPWELVQAAVERMAENDDVMRSDRLKQVMIELDEGFDEKAIGYSKYNRFLSEAATKGRIKLRKLENGQFEVAPAEGRRKAAAPAAKPVAGSPSGASAVESKAVPSTPAIPLDAAYDLLRRAVRDAAGARGGAVRDADVKRRMLELRADWDEAAVGFGRFSHFLHQAHNSDVINLHRAADGAYEVSLPGAPGAAVAGPDEDEGEGSDDQIATGAVSRPDGGRARGGRERGERSERAGSGRRGRRGGRDRDREPGEESGEREERAPRSRGGRGRGRGRDRDLAETLPPSEPRLSGDEATGIPTPAATRDEISEPTDVAPASHDRGRDRDRDRQSAVETTPATPATPAETPAAAMPAGLGRGRRGPQRGRPTAPPPLLPGQTIDLGGTSSRPATPAPVPSPEIHDIAPMDEQVVAPTEAEAKPARSVGRIPRLDNVLDPKQLGLPTEAGAVTRYLTNRYRGVGDKTAEQLVETFGAEHVFAALQAAPDRVMELLGAHRAGALLDAWRNDYARRSGEGSPMPSSSTVSRAQAMDDDEVDEPEATSEAAAFAAPLEPESAPELAYAAEASIETAPEPEPESEPEPFGDVEREQPVETTERETMYEASERETPAADVEREGAPDLWTTSRDRGVE